MRNKITDRLRDLYGCVVIQSLPELRLAYKQTQETSTICKLSVDAHLQSWGFSSVAWIKWMENTYSKMPQRFLADLVIASSKQKTEIRKSDRPPKCAYHEHDDEVPACTD